MAFGVSFLGDDEDPSQREQYQQAVEILSMRLPRIVGGGAIAPAPLLHGQGAQGSPFGHSEAALRQAFAQMAGLPPMGAQGGGAQQPGAPSMQGLFRPRVPASQPRIIPGIDVGAPAPQGDVSREWTPDPPLPSPERNPNELQQAAERSSHGYNAMRKKPEQMMGEWLIP